MNKIKIKFLPLFVILGIFVFVIVYRLPKNIALLNFKNITQEEPLFVSPEFNLPKYQSSLAYLQKEQSALLESYGFDEEIMPTGFLESLVEVKKASDNFDANPSYENSILLINSYKTANSAYYNGVKKTKENIKEAYSPEKEQTFLFPGSVASNTIMVSDLELMLKNSEALKKEIQKREAILRGKRLYFRGRKDIPQIPKTSISNTEGEVALNTQIDLVTSEGTYFLNTFCFQDIGTELPFVFLLSKNNQGSEGLIPKIQNNNYYQKFSTEDPVEKAFIEQGLDWHRIREGNSYRCNDLTYQVDLVTNREFVKKYKGDLLLKRMELEDPALKDAQKLEENILISNQGIYRFSELETLGDYYEYFWKKNKTASIAKDLRERYLEIKNQQSGLNLVLNTGFSFNNLTQRMENGAVKDVSMMKKYFMATRNNYSFAFLNFSDAVWLIKERPRYFSEYKKSDVFATYTDLIKRYDLAKIKEFDRTGENQILANY